LMKVTLYEVVLEGTLVSRSLEVRPKLCLLSSHQFPLGATGCELWYVRTDRLRLSPYSIACAIHHGEERRKGARPGSSSWFFDSRPVGVTRMSRAPEDGPARYRTWCHPGSEAALVELPIAETRQSCLPAGPANGVR
jgi:hypothetical protein